MRNKFRKLNPWFKYIIATSIGTLFIISSILISNQHKQINDLHYQLQVKQQTEQRASDYSETELDIETIEDKFNELILSFKTEMSHIESKFHEFRNNLVITTNQKIVKLK